METGNNGLGFCRFDDGGRGTPGLRGVGACADDAVPARDVQGAGGSTLVSEPIRGCADGGDNGAYGEGTRHIIDALADAYRLATGHEEFFARIHDALNGELERWLYMRLRTPRLREWRDDLVQATWFRVWERLPEKTAFDAPYGSVGARIRGWVYRVATNLHFDWARRETYFTNARHADRVAALHRDTLLWFKAIDEDGNPESVYLRAERGRIAAEIAAARLTPERRALLQMSGDGMSYAEIAEVLGTTLIGVKSRLHRAREAVRPYLNDIDA